MAPVVAPGRARLRDGLRRNPRGAGGASYTNQSSNLAQANRVEVDPATGIIFVGTTPATPGDGAIVRVR